MDIQFANFEHVLNHLPSVSVNPMWDRHVVTTWWDKLLEYRHDYGLIDRYLDDLLKSEVCTIDGLPYVQQVSAYLSSPSVWMVDGCYCAGQLFDHKTLEQAVHSAAHRWKKTVDVPAVFGQPGELRSKICNFDQPFKSKHRNEQKQALALHEGYTLTIVDDIPHDFMCESLDYWLSQGSPCDSALAAHCWTAACASDNRGGLFKFESPLGVAYVGVVNLGKDLVFNTFFQGLARPARIGTAALTATVNWLRASSEQRRMFLAAPRWGEELSYALYKSHLGNGEEEVGSTFAYYPDVPKYVRYESESQAWK